MYPARVPHPDAVATEDNVQCSFAVNRPPNPSFRMKETIEYPNIDPNIPAPKVQPILRPT